MTVTQSDARTVRVRLEDGTFSLTYRLWWNGHERRPESIVVASAGVRRAEVKAFFLFATVLDTVCAEGTGLRIERRWTISSPEPARLSLDVDVHPGSAVAWLLPGVTAGSGLPAEPVSVRGDLTAEPSGVLLFLGGRGIAAFVEQATAPTAIGLRRVAREDEPSALSIEVRSPPGEPPPSEEGGAPAALGEKGSVEIACTLRLLLAPAREIACRAAAAVPAGSVTAPPRAIEPAAAVEGLLAAHLVQQGSVTGLRDFPGSHVLSAVAGSAMAALLVRLYPDDPHRREIALRLADFCLDGQHPGGLCYEDYDLRRRRWTGARGRAPEPLVGLGQAARIADRLLALAELLAERDLPCEKYWIAGLRFVEYFLDEKGGFTLPGALHRPSGREPVEPGLAGFELFFPLARVLRRTGRDRYRKALAAMSTEFGRMPWGRPWLPSLRHDRAPDAAAALLCARLRVAMAELGLAPVPASDVAAVLVPWIVTGRREPIEGIDPSGALVDAFERQRLWCAGAETACALEGLGRLCGEPWLRKSLSGLAGLCRAFSDRLPPGTAWLLRAGDEPVASRPPLARIGPIDARVFVSEIGARLDAARSAAPRRPASRTRRGKARR